MSALKSENQYLNKKKKLKNSNAELSFGQY